MVLGTKVRVNILLLLVAWRLSSVFVVQTAHAPDEYWQSLEVAHKLVFRYGYLTWEWHAGIRSYIYPFLISILYRILSVLNLDFVSLLVTLPRIFQALLSAYTDYRFYIWTGSKFALFSLCTNWYWYYNASRTLINSVETCLTIIGLSFFPWSDSGGKNVKFLWIIGLLGIARPTAAIVWLPMFIYHVLNTSARNRIFLIVRYVAVALFYVSISTAIDTFCYGHFVVTPWEFFKINVLQRTSENYGTMHYLWYFTSALPVLLGLQNLALPFAVYQVCRNYSKSRQSMVLIAIVAWTMGVYSLLAHKEFRFILPLLPILIYLTTTNIIDSTFRLTETKRKLLIFLLIISNLLPGLYFSLIHQRGSMETMKVLRKELKTENPKADFLFLTPCHATPLYSHLHANISTRFLTCEPNLEGLTNYVDEADQFFSQPMKWLEDNYPAKSNVKMPSHLIIYDNVASRISKFLRDYKPFVRIFDTHFPQNSNYGENIVVYKRRDGK